MFRQFLPKVAMIGLAMTVFVAAVEAQKVRYNFMPGTNFSKYKTYKWVNVSGAEYPNQLIDNQIRQSIDRQLGSKDCRRRIPMARTSTSHTRRPLIRKSSGTRSAPVVTIGAMAAGGVGADIEEWAECQRRP